MPLPEPTPTDLVIPASGFVAPGARDAQASFDRRVYVLARRNAGEPWRTIADDLRVSVPRAIALASHARQDLLGMDVDPDGVRCAGATG